MTATGADQTVTKELIVEELLHVTADKDEVHPGESISFDANLRDMEYSLMGAYSEGTFIEHGYVLFIDEAETTGTILVAARTQNQMTIISINKNIVQVLNPEEQGELPGAFKSVIGEPILAQ